MKHAWLIIVFGLVLEFYLMTEPAFLIQETPEPVKVEEEIIFEEVSVELSDLQKLIEKEIKNNIYIIKVFKKDNKYFFELYFDDHPNDYWKEKLKEYESYLNCDCTIFLVQLDNPERIVKTYD